MVTCHEDMVMIKLNADVFFVKKFTNACDVYCSRTSLKKHKVITSLIYMVKAVKNCGIHAVMCTRDVAGLKSYESAKIKACEMTRDNVLAGTKHFELPLML